MAWRPDLSRARALILGVALLACLAAAGAGLRQDQERRRTDVDARLRQQAAVGAATVASSREAVVRFLTVRAAPLRTAPDAAALRRVLAETGARSGAVTDLRGRLVLGVAAEGRDEFTIRVPLGLRRLALRFPRAAVTQALSGAVLRIPPPWPAQQRILDEDGRLLAAWGKAPWPGAASLLRRADGTPTGAPLRAGGSVLSAAPIPGTGWTFVVLARRSAVDRSVRGTALLLPWLVLGLAALAGGVAFGLSVLARRRAASVRSERDRAAAVLLAVRDGFVHVRDGRVIDVNERLCVLGGCDRDALIGAGEEHPLVAFVRDTARRADGGAEAHAALPRADGGLVDVAVSWQPTGTGERSWIGLVRDIRAYKQVERRLTRLATIDALTGLLNRGAFDQQLAEVAAVGPAGGPVGLVIFDIDRFKAVNDRFGHPAGDEVLREVGRRLTQAARDGDLLYRLGGEEFAWVLPGVGLEEALLLAERVRAEVGAAPAGPVARVTMSAGVACSSGGDATSLHEAADGALLAAKRAGRDRSVAAD